MSQFQRIVLAAAAVSLAAWGWKTCAIAAPPDMDAMKRKVRSSFPKVTQISTAELQAWLGEPGRKQPVLLDTRTEKEFAVSHLRGAIRVEPSAKAEVILPLLPPGAPVVTYCSVGYRSSAVAERLMKAGVKPVVNLEGSIFQWANEGRPLEANGRSVDKVHPYDAKWGKLLEPARRAAP